MIKKNKKKTANNRNTLLDEFMYFIIKFEPHTISKLAINFIER